jgi:hypothetical protein
LSLAIHLTQRGFLAGRVLFGPSFVLVMICWAVVSRPIPTASRRPGGEDSGAFLVRLKGLAVLPGERDAY